MSETNNVGNYTVSDLYDDYDALMRGEDNKESLKKDVDPTNSSMQRAQVIAQDAIQKSEVTEDNAPKSEVDKTATIAQDVIPSPQPQEEETPKVEDTIASEQTYQVSQPTKTTKDEPTTVEADQGEPVIEQEVPTAQSHAEESFNVENSQIDQTQDPKAEETPQISEAITLEQPHKAPSSEVVQKSEEPKATIAPAVDTKAAPQKVAFPPLALRNISLEAVRKMDAALVKQHLRGRIEKLSWDPARKIVVIEQRAIPRRRVRGFLPLITSAHQIGEGSAAALVASKNQNFVLDYLKRM